MTQPRACSTRTPEFVLSVSTTARPRANFFWPTENELGDCEEATSVTGSRGSVDMESSRKEYAAVSYFVLEHENGCWRGGEDFFVDEDEEFLWKRLDELPRGPLGP